jgi:dipeptidyl aminopeptidase/acylaminoacyl peptidase
VKRRRAPFGSWSSPLDAAQVATAGVRISQPRRSGDVVTWLESRPAEAGRSVLVQDLRGKRTELTPAPFSARSRVHEYGGGSYCVAGLDTWFVNDEDQAVWHRDRDGTIRRVTPADERRYADLVRDPVRPRLLAVCEDHAAGAEPENSVVAIGDDGRVTTLLSGNDFYASLRIDRDGVRLAWLSWDHPRLPWDGNELWMADLDDEGLPTTPRQVAGGERVAVFQPEWLRDGRLGYVADPDGWWNHYAWRDGAGVERLTDMDSEGGLPQWVFGQSTWGEVAGGHLAAMTRDGSWEAWLFGNGGLAARQFWGLDAIEHLATDGREAVLLAGAPHLPTTVYTLDAPSFRPRPIADCGPLPLEDAWISRPEPIAFPTGDGATAYAHYYPPTNPTHEGPPGAAPPVIVKCHGGPTSAAFTAFEAKIQFWTTRGFAVLDVNYRGSTGFGRAYRESLYGRWGIAEVEDCVAGVRYLAERGLADAAAAFISGGSAGGFTVLSALAFTDVFRAGASYYGVADVAGLFGTTHKFESRYDHWLFGPLEDPATRQRIEERSPLHHAHRISCPVIFFQGGEDRVVPPEQSRQMHAALRLAGVPTAYLEFPEERHGFRHAGNIRAALEAELAFFCRALGVRPAGDIPSLALDNDAALH